MKFALTLALFGLLALAYSYPDGGPLALSEDGERLLSIWEPAGQITEEHVERFRRATCDLLSFTSKWISPNHSGCAAHCIVKGYKGGRCKDAVCHCRR